MLATQAQVASLESQAYLAKVLASELRQEAAKLAHQNTLLKQSAALFDRIGQRQHALGGLIGQHRRLQ
jgi:hypothetical protein